MTNIFETAKDKKIIAIVRGIEEEKLISTVQALHDGGIRLIEVTFDQSNKNNLKDTSNAIQMIVEQFPDMITGAGTVVKMEQLKAAYEAGGKLIISPDCNPEIIRETVKLGMLSIPGAFSPSEIVKAYDNGADFVKVFPAGNLGSNYIKAIRAPLNHIPLMAVGGVDIHNMEEFYHAGISGFGIGGSLVNKKMIESGQFEELKRLARQYVEIADSLQ